MGMRLWRGARAWLLVVAVVVACAPALNGGWVYDDWATAQHPAQDGWDDLLAVFQRDSSAYMMNQGVMSPVGVTYRPLSMASVIAVQAVLPNAPWVHHLISLALHLGCAFGLCLVGSRLRGDSESSAAWLIGALFALHPITIEAYGWINGRSDVLAGACIALLGCALPFGGARPRLAFCALAAAAAVLSKEPAVAAVAALCGAALLPARGGFERARLRAAAPAAAAGVAGAAAALVARALVTRGQVSGAGVLLSDPTLPASLAAAFRLALEHLILPLPRAMASLSYELSRPLQVLDWTVLGALVASTAALLWRRRLRAALLLVCALASILPALTVRNMVWLGFDRYLYMPYFLVCLACCDVRLAELAPRAGNLARRLALACLPLLIAASFLSAKAYASQNAWLVSLVDSRPDDPSGYVMATSWFLRKRDFPRARAAVLRTPRGGLTPALSHDLVEQLYRLGYPREALEIVEDTLRRYPSAGFARYDGMVARGRQQRFEEVYALARTLAPDRALCEPARVWLQGWLEQPSLPASQRPSVERVIADMRCDDGAVRRSH